MPRPITRRFDTLSAIKQPLFPSPMLHMPHRSQVFFLNHVMVLNKLSVITLRDISMLVVRVIMGRSALMTLIGPYLRAAPWGIPPGTELQPPALAGVLSSSASPKANMGTVSCLNRLGTIRLLMSTSMKWFYISWERNQDKHLNGNPPRISRAVANLPWQAGMWQWNDKVHDASYICSKPYAQLYAAYVLRAGEVLLGLSKWYSS